jgi:hypothetical protein
VSAPPAASQVPAKVVSPTPASPVPGEREKASRPATRALPGEPANRLSPNRVEGKQQEQRTERKEPERPARPQKGQEKGPQEDQGKGN